MGTWSAFLVAYLLGGLTFLPLLLLTILAHAWYTFPIRQDADRPIEKEQYHKDAIVQPGDDTSALDGAAETKTKRDASVEVAAGYFAVCREYTPMGINAKPIERATPVGSTTVAAPSPSVYQSMYRSLFERKGKVGANGQTEGAGMSQRPKQAGNVFYVVLRHGHLVLFDDEDQFEVRHVISLAHHDVGVYSGGDVTPEGELWIKRNALCLSRKHDAKEFGPDGQVSKPFYLFSENCSTKEDFYFALLRTKETLGDDRGVPKPIHFDVKNIISLVQKLHSTEDNVHTRWLNAMIGRVFLAIHQTKDIKSFISEKITKKISRVKTPSFLTNINIQQIDTGDAAPYFTNFKLRDLTVEGEAVVEADVRYTGNFRLEVAATAKLDLGSRMKAREVSLVLALTLKKIEGHVLFKIKPPPSNRVWVSFEKMPKMEMAVEPIVSARQITYAVILRQIENRIKEVLAETLVQPFWDDIPFFKTEHKNWRGGIFAGDDRVVTDNQEEEIAQTGDVEETEKVEDNPDLLAETRPMEKSHSFPTLDTAQPEKPQPAGTGLFGRKIGRPATATSPAASSTSIDTKPQSNSAAPSPKAFHNAPEPVVGTVAEHAEMFKPSTSPPDHATNYMAALHSRSQEVPAPTTPGGSPGKPSSLKKTPSYSSASSGNQDAEKENYRDDDTTPIASGRRNTTSSSESASLRGSDGVEPSSPASSKAASFKDQAGSIGRNFFNRQASNLSSASLHDGDSASSQKKNPIAAVSIAAAQARQWGWNAIQRQKDARKNSDASNQQVDLSQPMGRGQPLPPPGTPLPRPTNGKTKIGPGPLPVPKRKPVPGSPQLDKHEEEGSSLPNRRRRGQSHDEGQGENEEILVVAAPMDESDVETPGVDERADYMSGMSGETTAMTGGVNPSGSLTQPSISETSSTAATLEASQETQMTTPTTEPVATEGSVPSYTLDQHPSLTKASSRSQSPTKTSRSQSPTKPPMSLELPGVQNTGSGTPISGTASPSKAPDGRIIATPAATAEDDNEDDYSGWLQEETDPDQGATETGFTEKGISVEDKAETDVSRKTSKDERDAALLQEASY